MSVENVGAVKELLEGLEEDEIYNLAATVTRGFLRNKLNTREEATNAIIKYSPDVLSILKRKLITRDFLFNYLHNKNVLLTVPINKPELIDKILEYWGIKPDQTVNTIQNDNTEKKEEHSVAELALKFAEWFYSMMNERTPIGEEHFWADSRLKLNLISNEMTLNEEVNGNPKETVNLLFSTKTNHNLFFNPNLTASGTQGRIDPHGLVVILTCGTLHSGELCAGVYEQVFWLARDPNSDNNWKVKITELNLRSSEVLAQPCLENIALTKNLLSLPSN